MEKSGALENCLLTPEEDKDAGLMRLALAEAEKSGVHAEVPVGAVLVAADGTILARGGNRSIRDRDPSAHAEMVVLRRAGQVVDNYRLPGTTLYVTLEPCVMCAGLLVQARIRRLVFGATDPRRGGVVSRYRLGMDGVLNHSFAVTGGVLAEPCSRLLLDFFRQRR